jgi:hypothetical protein
MTRSTSITMSTKNFNHKPFGSLDRLVAQNPDDSPTTDPATSSTLL